MTVVRASERANSTIFGYHQHQVLRAMDKRGLCFQTKQAKTQMLRVYSTSSKGLMILQGMQTPIKPQCALPAFFARVSEKRSIPFFLPLSRSQKINIELLTGTSFREREKDGRIHQEQDSKELNEINLLECSLIFGASLEISQIYIFTKKRQ